MFEQKVKFLFFVLSSKYFLVQAMNLSNFIFADRLVVESSTGNPDDPDNLFLPNYCKVCDADLIQDEQAETHYMVSGYAIKLTCVMPLTN